MSNALKVDGTNFETEVLKSDVAVLVDFWAPWCNPCKLIGPIIDELAGEYNGKVKIAKINVDDNQSLASQYGIRGIPTVMIFKDGEVAASFVGVRPKEDLVEALTKVL
jgi:thioredoxin 1